MCSLSDELDSLIAFESMWTVCVCCLTVPFTGWLFTVSSAVSVPRLLIALAVYNLKKRPEVFWVCLFLPKAFIYLVEDLCWKSLSLTQQSFASQPVDKQVTQATKQPPRTCWRPLGNHTCKKSFMPFVFRNAEKKRNAANTKSFKDCTAAALFGLVQSFHLITLQQICMRRVESQTPLTRG